MRNNIHESNKPKRTYNLERTPWEITSLASARGLPRALSTCTRQRRRLPRVPKNIFFDNYTVQRRRSQHTRTLTHMNTCTQTLPL
jgi:hypothetical protein